MASRIMIADGGKHLTCVVLAWKHLVVLLCFCVYCLYCCVYEGVYLGMSCAAAEVVQLLNSRGCTASGNLSCPNISPVGVRFVEMPIVRWLLTYQQQWQVQRHQLVVLIRNRW